MKPAPLIASAVLIAAVLGAAAGLYLWKLDQIQQQKAAAAAQPEPSETIATAIAEPAHHIRTTTVIGTVRALRSVTLRNELEGTVAEVHLEPGAEVAAGTVLVRLDTDVEEADLEARRAEARLAAAQLQRLERALETRAASELDVERARSEHQVALAQIARAEAVIERKTVRAPFRARVGLADVHVGQYLSQGTLLTTLQGIDRAVHVDFAVPQFALETGLGPTDKVEVLVAATGARTPKPPVSLSAEIVAIDALVDVGTRNAMVRARLATDEHCPSPGSSVRVRVPLGDPTELVRIPATALRRGPQGDHVFVIENDAEDNLRAYLRPVVAGGLAGDDMLIAGGLEAGTRVAATGSFKLTDGSKVILADAQAPAPEGDHR